jgi:SAM-dependent methyltransferase
MKLSHLLNRSLIVLSLLVVTISLFAQEVPADGEFTPQIGQEGKDVVWVPTPQTLVDRMLDIAKVTPSDFVIDLGSGDGRTVITAAKRGAHSIGIEYNPDMVTLSKRNAVLEGVTSMAEFIQADLFTYDFSKATVITMFLLPDINMRLRPQLLDLKPGTRIVSNTFTMEDWLPDVKSYVDEDCDTWCTANLWIIPAKVGGIWTLSQGELTLTQEFQVISGALENGANSTTISEAKMDGANIAFSVGGTTYSGTVNGNTMQGTFTTGTSSGKWSATRK